MTTCYFVSDLHGNKKKYELLAAQLLKNRPSFLFLGGDLLPHSKVSEITENPKVNNFIEDFLIPLFRSVQKQLGCNYSDVFLIAGNDDHRSDIPGFLRGVELELWKYLENDKVRFGPYRIFGYPYVPPTPFRLKDWEKYDIDDTINPGCIRPEDGVRSLPIDQVKENNTIAQDLKLFSESEALNKSLFIMHSPPYNTFLDQIQGGISIGSKAIRNFIESSNPYITLHGHVHESPTLTGNWYQKINETHCFSAAYDGKGLAIVIFEIDDPTNRKRLIFNE